MSNVKPPPAYDLVVDEEGKANLSWLAFFDAIFRGDVGTPWTPAFVGLTENGGTATKSGVYYRLSGKLYYYRATVTPASGGTTSGTAGTTLINNFPIRIAGDGANIVVGGTFGGTTGINRAQDGFIYPGSWTSGVNTPVSIVGIMEV